MNLWVLVWFVGFVTLVHAQFSHEYPIFPAPEDPPPVTVLPPHIAENLRTLPREHHFRAQPPVDWVPHASNLAAEARNFYDYLSSLGANAALILPSNRSICSASISGALTIGCVTVNGLSRLSVVTVANAGNTANWSPLLGGPLTGTISSVVCTFSNLVTLGVGSSSASFRSKITGSVPPCLRVLSNLVTISMNFNQLAGEFPSLENFPNLATLSLANNQFTNFANRDFGSWPTTLFQIALQDNAWNDPMKGFNTWWTNPAFNPSSITLSGLVLNMPVPEAPGNCGRMVLLRMAGCGLTGTIPVSFPLNCVALQTFGVSSNQIRLNWDLMDNNKLESFLSIRTLELGFNLGDQISLPAVTPVPTLVNLNITNCLIGGTISDAAVDTLVTINTRTTAGALTRRQLWLSGNRLTGTIPQRIFDEFTLIDLSDQNDNYRTGLTGTIPNITARNQDIFIYSNRLTGTLPSSLYSASTLRTFSARSNQLTGTLGDFSNMTSLQELSVDVNQLTGNIPDSLYRLPSLVILGLGTNKFTGTISPLAAFAPQLQNLRLYSNQLSGTIPELCAPNLRVLNLGYNQLTGTLPRCLTSQTILQNLNIPQCALTGSIPDMSNVTVLNSMILNSNKFSGTIPDMFGQMTNLQYFVTSENDLFGTIPPSLLAVPGLLDVAIGNNRISGTLPPPALPCLLTRLAVQTNFITGTLPVQYTQCTQLGIVYLDSNRMNGTIPNAINNWRQAQYVYFGNNQFSGTIPDVPLAGARLIQFHSNKLNGSLPWSMILSRSTKIFRLENNQLTDLGDCRSPLSTTVVPWTYDPSTIDPCNAGVPQLTTLSGQNNRLNISLSDLMTCLKRAPNLASIDFSNNLISGQLSTSTLMSVVVSGSAVAEYAMFQQLSRLNLSSNFIGGVMPVEFASLPSSYSIDVSNNQLGGSLPAVLTESIPLMYGTRNQLFLTPSPIDLVRRMQLYTDTADAVAARLQVPASSYAAWKTDPTTVGFELALFEGGLRGRTIGSLADSSHPKKIVCRQLTAARSPDNLLYLDESYLYYLHCQCQRGWFWPFSDTAPILSNGSDVGQYYARDVVGCKPCPNRINCDTKVWKAVHNVSAGFYPAWPVQDLVIGQPGSEKLSLTDAKILPCYQKFLCNPKGESPYVCDGNREITSLLCSRCMKGFYEAGATCGPCNDNFNWASPLVNVVYIIIIIASLFFQEPETSSATGAVFAFWMQSYSMLKTEGYIGTSSSTQKGGGTTSEFASVLSAFQDLSNFQPFAARCLNSNWNPADNLYIIAAIPIAFTAFIPFLLLILAAVFKARASRPDHNPKQFEEWVYRCQHTLIALTWLIYMKVTQLAINTFRCVRFDQIAYMQASPYVDCDTTEYTNNLLPIGVLAFIVYTVGFPAFLLHRMSHYKMLIAATSYAVYQDLQNQANEAKRKLSKSRAKRRMSTAEREKYLKEKEERKRQQEEEEALASMKQKKNSFSRSDSLVGRLSQRLTGGATESYTELEQVAPVPERHLTMITVDGEEKTFKVKPLKAADPDRVYFFRVVYGFLFSNLRADKYWWCVTIDLLRKLVIALLLAVLPRGDVSVPLGIFFAIVVFLVLHVYHRPYVFPFDNYFETLTLMHLLLAFQMGVLAWARIFDMAAIESALDGISYAIMGVMGGSTVADTGPGQVLMEMIKENLVTLIPFCFMLPAPESDLQTDLQDEKPQPKSAPAAYVAVPIPSDSPQPAQPAPALEEDLEEGVFASAAVTDDLVTELFEDRAPPRVPALIDRSGVEASAPGDVEQDRQERECLLRFDAEFSDVVQLKRHFCDSVAMELAHSLGVPLSRIQIKKLSPGSVIVHVVILPPTDDGLDPDEESKERESEPTPAQIMQHLKSELVDPNSKLRRNKLMSYIKGVELLPPSERQPGSNKASITPAAAASPAPVFATKTVEIIAPPVVTVAPEAEPFVSVEKPKPAQPKPAQAKPAQPPQVAKPAPAAFNTATPEDEENPETPQPRRETRACYTDQGCQIQ